jgi:hypothetical protein
MDCQIYRGLQKLAVVAATGFALLAAGSDAFAQETEICVTKFYDANVNGVFDEDEVAIEGWRVALLTPDLEVIEGETDAEGVHCFVVPSDAAEYVVFEIFPDENWVSTTPAEVMVVAADGEDATLEVEFGNVCLSAGEGDARSKGFWSNRNGQSLIDEADLAALSALCLVNADGSDFDPASAEELAAWLKDADAVNMAYMLSAQLAAMVLNVNHEFADTDALIYAPGVSEDSDFATLGDVIAAADESLCSEGGNLTLPGHEERDYQEALKDALDAANNNAAFVSLEPCEFEYPVEEEEEEI